jgi:hypothetical protein
MYTLQQQVFALAMVASADYTEPLASSATTLETALSSALTNLTASDSDMGTWTMAWGPVVYESSILGVESGVEDNAVFVAQGEDADGNTVYVVSIAGTNPLSTVTDISQEDLDTTLSAWTYGVPTALNLSPNVTQGTLEGLSNLMGMQDPNTGDSLATFLQGVESTTATVIITGHSLGGALSPALALALFGDPGNTSSGGAGLDPADWSAVYVYPIAGPAVGDQDYATFYATTFPQTTDKQSETWNLLVWNSLDVVPHAWNQMSKIPKLYPDLASSDCLTKILDALKILGGSSYVQLQDQKLVGTFAAPSNDLKTVSAFVAEVVYQHVSAYFDLLNVSGVSTALNVPNPLVSPPSAALFGVCEFLTTTYCPLLEQFEQCSSPHLI